VDRHEELPGGVPGVSKRYLGQYVAMSERGYEVGRAMSSFLGATLGMRPAVA
jgi:hypothetical protein